MEEERKDLAPESGADPLFMDRAPSGPKRQGRSARKKETEEVWRGQIEAIFQRVDLDGHKAMTRLSRQLLRYVQRKAGRLFEQELWMETFRFVGTAFDSVVDFVNGVENGEIENWGLKEFWEVDGLVGPRDTMEEIESYWAKLLKTTGPEEQRQMIEWFAREGRNHAEARSFLLDAGWNRSLLPLVLEIVDGYLEEGTVDSMRRLVRARIFLLERMDRSEEEIRTAMEPWWPCSAFLDWVEERRLLAEAVRRQSPG